MQKWSCLLLFFILFFLAGCGAKRVVPDCNPGQGRIGTSEATDFKDIPVSNPGILVVSFFRNHISAVDSNRCPSYPSCSSYSLKAFQKHGFFIGWLMTVDRLFHEADEAKVSPLVMKGGRLKIFDPVGNNDFWWYGVNGSE